MFGLVTGIAIFIIVLSSQASGKVWYIMQIHCCMYSMLLFFRPKRTAAREIFCSLWLERG